MALGSDGGGNSTHRLQLVTIGVSLGVRGVSAGATVPPRGLVPTFCPYFSEGLVAPTSSIAELEPAHVTQLERLHLRARTTVTGSA